MEHITTSHFGLSIKLLADDEVAARADSRFAHLTTRVELDDSKRDANFNLLVIAHKEIQVTLGDQKILLTYEPPIGEAPTPEPARPAYLRTGF